jgi:hypothetical protein
MIHNWDQKIQRDAWYTSPDIAQKVVDWSKKVISNHGNSLKLIVEPSAGNGSFVNAIKRTYKNNHVQVTAMDIVPKHPSIKKKDFFTYEPNKDYKSSQTLVIGNPPYGVKSSLAMKFIKHAAKFADHIIFILSENFRVSDIFRNQLPDGFNIVKYLCLPQNIFVSEDNEPLSLHMNTCAFYITYTGEKKRVQTVKPNGNWSFVKIDDKNEAHLKIPRMGIDGFFKCVMKTSPQYWIYTPYDYFIKLNGRYNKKDICEAISNHKFKDVVVMHKLSSLRKKQLTKYLNRLID